MVPFCIQQLNYVYLFSTFTHFTAFLGISLDKKCFPLKISSVNVARSVGNSGFVTFTEEILNGKLHFLCSSCCSKSKDKHNSKQQQTETVGWRCSIKRVFLRFSHYNFIKKRFRHECFPVNVATFLRIFFYRTPPVAVSDQTFSIRKTSNYLNASSNSTHLSLKIFCFFQHCVKYRIFT